MAPYQSKITVYTWPKNWQLYTKTVQLAKQMYICIMFLVVSVTCRYCNFEGSTTGYNETANNGSVECINNTEVDVKYDANNSNTSTTPLFRWDRK